MEPRGWGRPLHRRVLDAAGVGPGTALLDVGCGTGDLARAAVDRGARVTGVDLDARAIAVAQRDVPEARFDVGDTHDLAFGDGAFDVVVAVQLLMHVPDPLRVLGEAGRVGRVVAVTVWGREQECDVRVFGEALAPWLPPRHEPAGPPPLTEPLRLRRLAELAGLTVAALDEVVCPFDYADEEELLGPLWVSGLGRAAMRTGRPGEVRQAVLDRVEPLRHGTGYRLNNLFRVLVAHP